MSPCTLELAGWLMARPRRRQTLLIGMDGPGGSGKTTLAAALANQESALTIVHMDDFYLPSAEQLPLPHLDAEGFDWRRLERDVLAPLARDEAARYRRYDWSHDALDAWATTPPGGAVIVEGVSAMRRELRSYYDVTVFVACPRETCLRRGLARDGESARGVWEGQWLPAEESYFARHGPRVTADIVVDGED